MVSHNWNLPNWNEQQEMLRQCLFSVDPQKKEVTNEKSPILFWNRAVTVKYLKIDYSIDYYID